MKWHLYSNIEEKCDPGEAVYVAEIVSKNGASGCAWIVKHKDGFCLEAASNTTGKFWKSPDTIFPTIDKAKKEAERIWK